MSEASPPLDAAALAARARRLIDALLAQHAPGDVLAEVDDLMAKATDRLAPHLDADPAARGVYATSHGDWLTFFRHNPIIGRDNPLAPEVALRFEPAADAIGGQELVATTTLGIAHEGPIGLVHGGVIAGLFDQFLALVNIDNGLFAYTGTLTISYRGPCPLGVELELRCRTVAREGRKVRTTGELRAGGRLVAEAEGVFVEPSPEAHEAIRTHGGG